MRFELKFIFLLLLIPILNTFSQTDSLIISEVMFYPSASNSEFVEIYNLSYQNSVDLSKYQIIYSTANADTILQAGDGIILPSRSFAVVFEGDYDLTNGIYSEMVPSSSVKLQIEDNAFGSSGMANTSDRAIYLVNPSGDTVDVYIYSANNSSGISDEKIILGEDSSPSNWANSLLQNGTPGNDNSVSPKRYDLSVTDLHYTPTEIFEGDNVQFTSVIKNVGTSTSSNFAALLFIDINKDSVAQQNEIIVSHDYSSLSSEDSIELNGQSDVLPVGNYNLYTLVDFNIDEDLSNNIYSTSISIFPKLNSYNDIVISEIMYAPTDGEPEWLEIYNRSDSAINLNNWRIADKTSSPIIIDTVFFIQPHEYLVISKDESIHDFYSITSPVIVVNLPSLNNTGDDLKLLDSLKRNIDSVNYVPSWGGQNGYSLEKIDPNEPGNDAANWGSSVSYLGGTPGKINSITPKEHDLAVAQFYIETDFVYIGESVKINTVVKNLGTNSSGNYSLQIFHDINADSIAQESELVYQFDEAGLASDDSIDLYVELFDFDNGENYYIAKLNFDDDSNSENNFAFLSFIGVETNEIKSDIVINEIMYAPNKPEPEWIEFYNRSDKIIDLKNYQIADKTDTTKVIDDNIMLEPDQYFVVAKDSSFLNIYGDTLHFVISDFPNLNNTGDRLMILDSLNRVIDSLEFTPDWGGKNGVSLERIDSELLSIDSTNWGNAKLDSGGTPGVINSITPKEYDLAIIQFNTVNDHAIIGETVKLNAVIKNIGRRASTAYMLKIFHDINADSIAQENELVYQFDEIALAPNDSASLFVELNDYYIGANYYISELIYNEDLNVENNLAYLNLVGIEINEIRNDIVINEIMYAPNSPEPEWVELFNRSDKTINLRNYQIADMADTAKVITDDILFKPYQYYVIAKDSTFITVYSDTLDFTISAFPNLNNTGDRLMILDSLNRVIDSLEFNPNWGGKNGVSLERIDSEFLSTDSTNWASAKLDSGGTPGIINSIIPKEYDLTIDQFSAENDYVIIGEVIKFNVMVRNIGKRTSTSYNLKLFHDINADSIAQENELVYQFDGNALAPNDSANIHVDINDYNIGANYYIAELIYDEDLYVENNFAYLDIVGVEINEIRNDIVINEIMYAPNKPEPEWIELFNRSDKTINLRNYQIADNADTVKVIDNNMMFLPNQYFVFAKDSSFITVYNDTLNFIIADFPNLNNTGDRLIILDSLNRVIDSLEFNPNWGGKNGVSLERYDSELLSIDSTNWGSSKLDSGGTPGFINSITQRDFDVGVSQINFDPTFPLYGERVRISANIKNRGKNNLTCSLQLFEDVDLDTVNFQLLETTNLIDLNKGDSISVEFNHTIDSIKKAHAFLVEVISSEDQDTSNNKLYSEISLGYPPKTLVINEIMYSPINGEPEWIEFYNTSGKEVNLKNWLISDIYTTPKVTKITDKDLLIQGEECFVIAKDSTIWEFHKTIPSSILISDFANMNNDIDGVVIKDQYGNLIDSVEYKSNWGGTSGYSLERRFYTEGSNDSTNWNSSMDIELSTPGRENSITPKSFDLKVSTVTTSPEFPTINEDVFVKAIIHNVGINEVNNFSVSVKILKQNILSELELFNDLTLENGDSLILKTEDSFVLDDSVEVICAVISNSDNDSTNNSYSIILYPSFLKNSIIINEFMANPNKDEAEWIELYNNSQTPINIKNWMISDLLTSPTKRNITYDDTIIQADEYFIITSDTSKLTTMDDTKIFEANFGALGNYDDGILLYDFNSKIIDSLRYDKDWDIEKGRSLERVSFDASTTDISNWLPSLSITGSTPGTNNSILETQPYVEGNIKINEIMFDTDNNNSEFIELYNNTDSPVDIGGWSMIDASENYFELSKTFYELSADEYFIFAADSSLFNYYPELENSSSVIIANTGNLSLSNDDETIMVLDHWGNVIDSINYNSKWHNKNINISKNKSLERINPNLDGNDKTNWSTSVDPVGATPIRQNSIYTEGKKSEAKLSFSPNPFSPDNDGYEDFTLISYNLSVNTAQIRIKIFDDKGRLVRTLVNNKASAAGGTEIFDGLDDNGNPLRIGMYIVFIEASNSENGIVDVLKDVIVIARKL